MITYIETPFQGLHIAHLDSNERQILVETPLGLKIVESSHVFFVPVDEVLSSEPSFEFNGLLELVKPRKYNEDKYYLSNKGDVLKLIHRSWMADYDNDPCDIPTKTFDEWRKSEEVISHYTATCKENHYCVVLYGKNESRGGDGTVRMLWDFNEGKPTSDDMYGYYGVVILPVHANTPKII